MAMPLSDVTRFNEAPAEDGGKLHLAKAKPNEKVTASMRPPPKTGESRALWPAMCSWQGLQ